MTEARTVVKVWIGGDEYTLRSDRPADYTQAVAQHVDRTLKEVQQAGSAGVETHKAAILAALAITDELFQARAGEREMAERLKRLAGELARLLPPAKRASRSSGSVATREDGS
ncbi:MAG: cell division protein ZapA [Gemmatimonadetes bacterium]|nr:cell division protein ZapA [Gemmatimonadota bacterium]MBI2535981.1 cell division protein ZapA [Gemmatimonadota bacterium]MBI2615444.1 cell division protein ZapA [Gemmatimonadota bacterium]